VARILLVLRVKHSLYIYRTSATATENPPIIISPVSSEQISQIPNIDSQKNVTKNVANMVIIAFWAELVGFARQTVSGNAKNGIILG